MCTTFTVKYNCAKCLRRVDTHTDTDHCVFYRTGAYGLCQGEDFKESRYYVSEDECEACVEARIKEAEEQVAKEKAAQSSGAKGK